MTAVARRSRRAPVALRADAAGALALAGATVALAFLTSGNANPSIAVGGSYTWSEIACTLLGAGACATAIALGAQGRRWGAVTVALMGAFVALAALSILWSVVPDWSWYGANQLLCCLSVFAGAAALARVFPRRWGTLLGGVAAGAVALSVWALLAKVFPATLAPSNTYGRLQAPFGYWNAVGLAAAMGLPACLWASTRDDGARALHALSIPALAVLIAVVVLSYSRSAALAAIVGLACSIAFGAPRLRAALSLAASALAALAIVLWALHDRSLTGDNIAIARQDVAGHRFGVVLVVVLALASAAGWAIARGRERVTLSATLRRRISVALVVALALVPVAVVAGLAASHRGLTGEVSHVFDRLTSSASSVGDTSTRLTQLGSSRPVYWHEGIEVGAHSLAAGAGELGYGIARLRFATKPYVAYQAHSWLVQTFADLGLIGLALTLALLIAWALAAARTLGLAPRLAWAGLGERSAAERRGLAALAAIVVCFGVQSALDWTWYFMGVTLPALACAGWLAGRGPLTAPVGARAGGPRLLDRIGALAALGAVTTATLVGCWLMWEPLRSTQAYNAAVTATTNSAALADARTAANANPLSVQPLFLLASLYSGVGNQRAAREQLVRSTQRQPSNPDPWARLASFDLRAHPHLALAEATRVVVLDPSADALTREAWATIAQAQADIRAAGTAG
ncbi:MAG: O-antigen ligase family protein [Solirubrobacteraceae bacterium]